MPLGGSGSPTGRKAPKRRESEEFHESIEEKKEKVFKWANMQQVRMGVDDVKKELLECSVALQFLNLFEGFQHAPYAWGDNSDF